MVETITVGEYLTERLAEINVKHVFGVPGDFALRLCDQIAKRLTYVGCSNELNAAYSADGYARINGAGCLVVTFGVGEFSAMNGIAGSFAERVPVILLVGMPPTDARIKQLPLHHTFGSYDIPRKSIKRLTSTSVIIDSNIGEAIKQIDSAILTCIKTSCPVYIGIPSDLVLSQCIKPSFPLLNSSTFVHQSIANENSIQEAVNESAKIINESKNPIVIGDLGVIRAGAKEEFKELVEKFEFPFVIMLMAKGNIIDETHPQFLGVYHGRKSREIVWKQVEESDCIIHLGVVNNERNTGGFTMNFLSSSSKSHVISVNDDKENSIQVHNHMFFNTPLKKFLQSLLPLIVVRKGTNSAMMNRRIALESCEFSFKIDPPQAVVGKELTANYLFKRLACELKPGCIVVTDTGVAGSYMIETLLPPNATFISQAFYISIGHSLPASFGASIASSNQRHVFLIIGDGALQMTAQELGTIIRNGCKMTIVVISNSGYTIERLIFDGPFNDLAAWKYYKLPNAFGSLKKGCIVKTEDQFDAVLSGNLHCETETETKLGGKLDFIEAVISKDDAPISLKQSAEDMRRGLKQD